MGVPPLWARVALPLSATSTRMIAGWEKNASRRAYGETTGRKKVLPGSLAPGTHQLDEEDAEAHGDGHGIGPPPCMKLFQDGGHVELHGMRGDPQGGGDRPVPQPLRHHGEDLEFPRG